MSEYGIKIKNYQAGAIYEVMTGVRQQYDVKDAMLTNSLFSEFLLNNGLKVKNGATRDIICLEFNYGSRSFDEELKHIMKIGREFRQERHAARASRDPTRMKNAETKRQHLSSLYLGAIQNQDKYEKVSNTDLRIKFYEEGVPIRYPKYGKRKVKGEPPDIVDYEVVKYKMLFRTPGKAKKGSCMFIRDSLYKKAHNFLWMGLRLPKKNAPIVEIGAYSSLITSSIVGKVQIKPEEILIVKDVDAFFETNVTSIETDDQRRCLAVRRDGYKLKNTLFDGQALIDSSIFPDWGDGYVLLRHHFFKAAAFNTNIQLFFHDWFGADYDTAELTDMWGNKVKASEVKLITTDNAIKWLKFDVSFSYWAERLRENDCMFGIVKTAHPSKLGDVQRMSYQMVNALDESTMDAVLDRTKSYIYSMKTDDNVFLDFLQKNANFSNDYEVLIALCKHNPSFTRCDYFRDRKKQIISSYVSNLKQGRVIQNADNLVIVGSPYAMLLHSVGADPMLDPTFTKEDVATQCYTGRFSTDEYLAEFRNPFNGRANLGLLHNVDHPYFHKYFNLGELIVAINMIRTDFQDKNNGFAHIMGWISA